MPRKPSDGNIINFEDLLRRAKEKPKKKPINNGFKHMAYLFPKELVNRLRGAALYLQTNVEADLSMNKLIVSIWRRGLKQIEESLNGGKPLPVPVGDGWRGFTGSRVRHVDKNGNQIEMVKRSFWVPVEIHDRFRAVTYYLRQTVDSGITMREIAQSITDDALNALEAEFNGGEHFDIAEDLHLTKRVGGDRSLAQLLDLARERERLMRVVDKRAEKPNLPKGRGK